MIKKLKNIYVQLALGGFLVLLAYILFSVGYNKLSQDISRDITSTLNTKAKKAEKYLDDLDKYVYKNGPSELFKEFYPTHSHLLESEGFVLAYYNKDSIEFWTDNRVPLPTLKSELNHEKIIHLQNGWYYKIEREKRYGTSYVFLQIQHDYPYQNEYLENKFHTDFNYPGKAEISIIESEDDPKVLDENGEFLFTIKLPKKIELNENRSKTIAFLFVISFLFILNFLRLEFNVIAKKIGSFKAIAGLVLIICVVRYWMLASGFPAAFQQIELFQPELYASSFLLPSLGDFLINAYLAFYLLYFAYRQLKEHQFSNKITNSKFIPIVVSTVIFILFYYSLTINELTKGLIEHSQIYFNINNLFGLSYFTLIGIITVGLLFFTYFIAVNIVLHLANNLKLEANKFYFILFIIGGIFISVFSLYEGFNYPFLHTVWPLMVFYIAAMVVISGNRKYTLSSTVGVLVVFALVAGFTLSKYGSNKEKNKRIAYALKLSNEEDINTELEFSKMENSLLKSNLIENAFKESYEMDKSDFDHKLEQHFFNKYWDRYDIDYYLFDTLNLPVGINANYATRSQENIQQVIKKHSVNNGISPFIHYVTDYTDKLSYIIQFPVKNTEGLMLGKFYAELRSKKIPKDIGFPELLLDKNTQTIEELVEYSYIRYKDTSLLSNIGTYNYSIFPDDLRKKLGNHKHLFYDENGYNHLVYNIDDKSLLVLSKQDEDLLQKATTFSYLFALFSLLALIGIILKEIPKGFQVRRLNLKSKIQFLVVGLILISLILFVVATRFFIEDQYQDKNKQIISEKIKSVHIEMKKKLGDWSELKPDVKPYTDYLTKKFSDVFFTDINLYNLDGKLISASRDEMFYAGMLSKKMQPDALIKMKLENNIEYVQEEKIGNMNYLSAYVPFINKEGKILAYLNLTYYAQQNPIEKDLYNFMVAIINIFVVLFALSIVAALFVSNWVTKPLKLLQSSVSNIEFGKSNKPIEYTGNDEIGNLVLEYNKKVAELEDAANQLAKSERESAWREMAKQVAHEIKNPLTPMKLSVQHFERSFNKHDENADERIARFSKTMIEQIETLTNIADEFSNFAKMPKAKLEKTDLISILQGTVDLFKESDTTEISFSHSFENGAYVMYDKDQLVRVFNNLVKNALQAISKETEGKIEIRMTVVGHNYLIEVKDNGCGIDPDKVEKIFVPNFTTKSTGMGLGLAMVKNIIQNAHGKIWFDTEVDKGTSFFVTLPVYEG